MSLLRSPSAALIAARSSLWMLSALSVALHAAFPAAAQEAAPAAPVAGGASIIDLSKPPLAGEAAALGIGAAPGAPASGQLEPGRARILAGLVSKQGSIVTVQGEDGRPAVVESGDVSAGGTRIQAQSLRLDTTLGARTLQADGQVRIERSRLVRQPGLRTYGRFVRRDVVGRPLALAPGSTFGSHNDRIGASGSDSSRRARIAGSILPGPGEEFFTEVLEGSNLAFDGGTQQGSLDGVRLQASMFDLSASGIVSDERGYQARQIVVRPGGLSERDREIYGTPPFSLRAESVVVPASGGPGQPSRSRVVVRRPGLYFRNKRLLPIPPQVLAPFAIVSLGSARGASGAAVRAPQTLRITPRVGLSSADGLLLGARLSLALSRAPGSDDGAATARGLSTTRLNTDLGISARLGFRGGVSLENRSPLGLVALRARRADLITTQLYNRLELNRFPELSFDSPLLPVLSLGSGRGVAAFASGAAGRLSERARGSREPRIESSRLSGTIGLTTRLDNRPGFYADVFATRSRYGLGSLSYTNTGFEVGYLGRVLPGVRGLFSLRHTSLGGSTPFRFDLVEIPRELRTTFDIEATPRYLIPIDLRYDLDRKTLRDKSVGVLRNYKTFAYGVVYQAARHDLRLELRSNF